MLLERKKCAIIAFLLPGLCFVLFMATVVKGDDAQFGKPDQKDEERNKRCTASVPEEMRKVMRFGVFNYTIRDSIVKPLNDNRRSLAKGEFKGKDGVSLPAAGNMNELTYDFSLAKICQKTTDDCKSKAETDLTTEDGQDIFQFLVLIRSQDPNYYDNNEAFKRIFTKRSKNEPRDFSIFTQQRGDLTEEIIKNYDGNTKVSDLVALLWAKSMKIGCGYTQYNRTVIPKKDGRYRYDSIVTCCFVPAGNIQGESVYEEGEACSKCDEGVECKDSLCQPPPPPMTTTTEEPTTTTTEDTSNGSGSGSSVTDIIGTLDCSNDTFDGLIDGLVCPVIQLITDIVVAVQNFISVLPGIVSDLGTAVDAITNVVSAISKTA